VDRPSPAKPIPPGNGGGRPSPGRGDRVGSQPPDSHFG
jgi:hypothetical protein